MKKIIRFLSVALTAVCLLSSMNLIALAAVTVASPYISGDDGAVRRDKITVSADSSEFLTVTNNTNGKYTIKVDDQKTVGGLFGGYYYTGQNRTLTFTNTYDVEISFDYSISDSNTTSKAVNSTLTAVENCTDDSTNGTITMQPAGSFQVKVTSSSNKSVLQQFLGSSYAEMIKNTCTFTLSNFQMAETQAKISFVAPTNGGSFTVTNADGSSVAVDGTAVTSQYYNLSASPATGYRFCRWVFTNSSGDVTYFDASSGNGWTSAVDGTITCEFIPKDAAIYTVDGVPYGYLDQAITAAEKSTSSPKQIVLFGSGSVLGSNDEKEFTIPSDVQMVLPYAEKATTVQSSTASFPYGNYTQDNLGNGKWYPEPIKPGTASEKYKLTIPQGTTIVNKGIIAVGATLSGSAAVCGNHATLQVDGKLTLPSSTSVLSACGYITGGGTVQASGGRAKIYQPMVLLRVDSHGWLLSASSINMQTSPKDANNGGVKTNNPSPRYTTQNIQCNFKMACGDALYGYVDQVMASTHYMTAVPLVGEGTGLIGLKSNASLSTSYAGSNTSAAYQNIGKLTVTISGGATQGNMKANLGVEVDMSDWPFPVPYNYDLILTNGEYDLNYDLSLLPGAGLKVASGATLNIKSGKSLAVFTGANDHSICPSFLESSSYPVVVVEYGGSVTSDNGKYQNAVSASRRYPRNSTLSGVSGGSLIANFVVDGTLNINGSFGGIVQTNGTGTINMNVSPTTIYRQFGMTGNCYDSSSSRFAHAGATVYSFTPQIYTVDGELLTMENGKVYKAANDETNTVETFAFDLYPNSADTEVNEEIEEALGGTATGQWYDCELTFDANAGEETVEGEMEALKVNSGATVTLPENNFVREGYTFTGWNTAADGNGTAFNIEKDESGNALPIAITVTDDIIVTDAETGVGKVILYAQWEKDEVSCKLILDPNYEGEGVEKTEVAITPGETYGAAFEDGELPTLEREGYYFEGWFEEVECLTQITAETNVEVPEGTTEITLYAKWTEKSTPTGDNFTVTPPESPVYDGTAKNVTVTVASEEIVGMGEISVKYLNADNEEVAADHVINAGTYTYNISVAEGDRYLAAENVKTGTFTIKKADRSAPAVTGTDETISGKNDGSISGLTTEMEWSTDQKEWKPINGTELTSLEPGTYYIRYAENENYNASPAAEVIIKSGRMISITWKQDDGSVIGTTEVAYNEMPSHADAEKAVDKDYYYTFSGWTPEVVAATEDATYTATYEQTARTYGEPTWTWDGTESAAASFTTNDGYPEFEETVNAQITKVHVDATCEKDGSDTYTATVTFGGKEYTNDNTEVIEALGHNYGETSYIWADDGKSCTAKRICGNDTSHVEEVTATITSKITNPASCTVMGTTTYTATFDVEWAAAQTTTRQDVAVIAHTYDQKKIEDTYKKSDATCTAAAVYYYSCSCGEKGTETFEYGDMLAHSYGKPQFTWSGYECSAKVVCDCSHEQSVDVTVTSEVTTTATCTVEGVKTYTATAKYGNETYTSDVHPTENIGLNSANHVNTKAEAEQSATCTAPGYTAGTYCKDCQTWISGHEEIEALKHSWSVSYSWSEDGKSCTATRVCANDAAHNETETVTAIGAVKTEATCETMGWTTYTADFEAEWAETQTKDVQDIARLQHSYTGEIKSDGDGQTATHSYKCVNGCNEYGGAVKHAWNDGEQTKDPACEAAGEMTYTCTVEGCGATYTEEIKTTGHVNTTSKTEQNTDGKTHTTTVTCDCGHVVSTTTENCIDRNNDFACDGCRGLLVNAYTDAIAVAEGYTAEKSVDGSTVTLNYTGDVAFVQAQGTGAWNHWVGFKITSPVDMSKVTILRPDNQTRVMADIKDGDDYAYLYWGMTNDSDKKAEYKIDWNGDGTYDLTVILDATEAKLLECSHSWGEGVVTTPASCTAEGTMTYTCANCGATKPETIQATGHKNTVTVNAKDATCGEAGYTGDTYCNDCETIIATGEVIQATGAHIYDDPEWNWEGSDAEGYTAATVTVKCTCGDAKTGTDRELDKVTTDATYEADGSVVYTAKVTIEGKEYTDTRTVTIPKLVGYTVTFDVFAKDLTKGPQITLLDGTTAGDAWNGEGEATAGETVDFTVTYSRACTAVIATTDDAGNTTYSKIPATATADTNTYRFTTECAEDMQIIIALKGDVDMSGGLNVLDVIAVKKYVLTDPAKHQDLTDLQKVIAKVSSVLPDKIIVLDATDLQKSILTDPSKHIDLKW